MKLALRHVLLHSLLLMASLGALYWAIYRYSVEQTAESLVQELHDLEKLEATHGDQMLKQIVASWSTNTLSNERYFLLINASGEKLAGNLAEWPAALPSDEKVHQITLNKTLFLDAKHQYGQHWPMIAIEFPNGSKLMIAESNEAASRLSDYGIIVISVVLLVSVLLTLALGFILGRSVLNRTSQITDTVSSIINGDLKQRMPVSNQNDEFDQLSDHLNLMLDQIETLMQGMRQVTNNIAHDLRKPLSRLKNRLDVTLLEQRSPQEYEDAMTHSIEDADELLKTFSELLEIAQTEAGAYRGNWSCLNISDIAEVLVTLYRDQAETHDLNLVLRIEPNLFVNGNRHLMNVMLSNLLDNAVKFSPAGSTMYFCAQRLHDQVRMTITDQGFGIPASQHAQVLNRFVRLDAARSTEGNGLGLSLVNAVIKLHRGKMLFADNHPGLIVILSLPASTDEPPNTHA